MNVKQKKKTFMKIPSKLIFKSKNWFWPFVYFGEPELDFKFLFKNIRSVMQTYKLVNFVNLHVEIYFGWKSDQRKSNGAKLIRINFYHATVWGFVCIQICYTTQGPQFYHILLHNLLHYQPIYCNIVLSICRQHNNFR